MKKYIISFLHLLTPYIVSFAYPEAYRIAYELAVTVIQNTSVDISGLSPKVLDDACFAIGLVGLLLIISWTAVTTVKILSPYVRRFICRKQEF